MTQAMPLWTVQSTTPWSMKWFGSLAMVVLLSVLLVLAGCSFSSFIQAAEADLPIVLQIILNITNVVAPAVSLPIQTDGNLAIGALQLLCGTPAAGATKCDANSLVGQYQASPSQDLLQKIQQALATVNTHIAQILAFAKGLPANVGTSITVAVGLALSTITAILTMIPPNSTPSSLKATMAKAVPPPQPNKLKLAYNNAIASQWPTAVVH